MKKKTLIILTILTCMIAFMDISGLPSVALIKLTIADIDPYIIPLLVNFMLCGGIVFLTFKLGSLDLKLGLTNKGLFQGIKEYGWIGLIAGALSCIAFIIGLYPFDYTPTIWKILIEGIVYYIGVGMIEELYVRGLFLNLVEAFFHKNRRNTQIAIIVSAGVFGIGHIPGMIGMGAMVVAFKVISTIGMGLYFGTIYKKTNNLWVPMIMHSFIDMCALPYCFTSNMRYPMISLILLVVIYLGIGCYSVYIMSPKSQRHEDGKRG